MSYDLIFAFSFALSTVGFAWFAFIRDTDDRSMGETFANYALSVISEYKLGLNKGIQICQQLDGGG